MTRPAAAVLRGVSWALELPKAPAARTDPLRLVVRTDASEGKGLASDLAMEELFGEGAGVVLAGLDGRSADHALKWGEDHGLPVVLLHPPARQPLPTQAGYVIGEARYVQLPGTGYADFALIVDDDYQGKGIASFLFLYLLQLAKERGLKGLSAHVLATNKKVLRVLEKSPHPIEARVESGVYELTIPFDRTAAPSAPKMTFMRD